WRCGRTGPTPDNSLPESWLTSLAGHPFATPSGLRRPTVGSWFSELTRLGRGRTRSSPNARTARPPAQVPTWRRHVGSARPERRPFPLGGRQLPIGSPAGAYTYDAGIWLDVPPQ